MELEKSGLSYATHCDSRRGDNFLGYLVTVPCEQICRYAAVQLNWMIVTVLQATDPEVLRGSYRWFFPNARFDSGHFTETATALKALIEIEVHDYDLELAS